MALHEGVFALHRLRKWAAAAVVLLCFAGQAQAADFYGGWESGKVLPVWDSEHVDFDIPVTDQIRVQSRVHRWGRTKAAKFTVRPGQIFGGTTGERAEVVKLTRENEGDTYWYSWSTKIPLSWRPPSMFAIIFNAHASFPWQAPLTVNLHGENVELLLNGGELSETGAAPYFRNFPLVSGLHRGLWQNFALHIKWSLTGGSISVYWKLARARRWRHVLDVSGIPTMQAKDGVLSSIYIKHGLYRNRGETFTNFLYHDRFRRTRGWPFR